MPTVPEHVEPAPAYSFNGPEGVEPETIVVPAPVDARAVVVEFLALPEWRRARVGLGMDLVTPGECGTFAAGVPSLSARIVSRAWCAGRFDEFAETVRAHALTHEGRVRAEEATPLGVPLCTCGDHAGSHAALRGHCLAVHRNGARRARCRCRGFVTADGKTFDEALAAVKAARGTT